MGATDPGTGRWARVQVTSSIRQGKGSHMILFTMTYRTSPVDPGLAPPWSTRTSFNGHPQKDHLDSFILVEFVFSPGIIYLFTKRISSKRISFGHRDSTIGP